MESLCTRKILVRSKDSFGFDKLSMFACFLLINLFFRRHIIICCCVNLGVCVSLCHVNVLIREKSEISFFVFRDLYN